jgi:hypothetical protein
MHTVDLMLSVNLLRGEERRGEERRGEGRGGEEAQLIIVKYN